VTTTTTTDGASCGWLQEDLKAPDDEIGKEMKKAFNDGKDLVVTVVSAMGKEQIMAFKEVAN
jgi:translation initiation factor 5A